MDWVWRDQVVYECKSFNMNVNRLITDKIGSRVVRGRDSTERDQVVYTCLLFIYWVA